MTRYAIHELGTSQIQRVVSCHPDMLQWQLRGTEVAVAVADGVGDDTHYFKSGVLTALPPQPHPTSTWSWESLSWSGADLDRLRTEKWDQIKSKRAELAAKPIPVRDFFLDSDPQAQVNVMASVMAMERSGAQSKNWRCADNVMRELSLADLTSAGIAIDRQVQSAIETSDSIYQAIQAAESAEAINAINWSNE